MVKFLPGFGALAGGMLRAASEAAEIYVVAIIYYHILSITKTADRETLTDDYLKKIVRECMTQRQEELKSIFLSAKSIFKKADPSAIKKAEKEIKNQMDKDTSKEYLDVVQALKDTKPSTK